MFDHCAKTKLIYRMRKKYLGRLAGRYVKKNTFNNVATIAKQNSNNSNTQNWSLIVYMNLADPSPYVYTKIVGITNPVAVPTIFITANIANAKDLYLFFIKKIHFAG